MAKGSTELVQPDKSQMFDLLTAALERRVDIAELYDSEQVQRALAQGILTATTEDEVYADANLLAWSELVGVPVEVASVHFNPSQVENGPGIYAVVKLTRIDTGEQSTRHVGGYRPVAQLLWEWQRDRFPIKRVLVEVAGAKPGQSAPLGLRRLDATEAP